MDLTEVLTERFVVAIRKAYDPCPLIGEKWFNFLANDKPVRFRFSGTRKLAKATKDTPENVAERIVGNLDLQGLNVNVKVAKNWDINVFPNGSGQGGGQ